MRKYSILMSVYYKEKPIWLKESIESMLSQTVKAEEFFIVKDGPLTDELDEVIDGYVKNYPELFTILALKKNMGLGPALAEGVKNCRNEIIIRMDSDDYSVPERCEKLLRELDKHPECGIIGSHEAEFSDDMNNPVAIHRVPETSEQIHAFMRRRCALLHPTVLYAGTKIWGRFDLKEANACAAVSKTSVPVLIIHGDKDKNAPVSMAYKIYNSCKSERELYIVSEAGHTGCYRTDPEKYKMIVSEFIEKHIPR